MKKLLSIILSLVMVIAALPLSVIESSATEYVTSQDGEWIYYIDPNGDAVIYSGNTNSSAYLGSDTDVVVPSTLDGYDVVSIGQYTFKGKTTLESIVIPNTVNTIANNVFQDCTNLATVTFGNSVGIIGPYAFYNCTSLESISLPASLQTIGERAFQGCNKITYLDMGSGVTTLGVACFAYLSSLENVTIGSSVQTINSDVFYGCSNLKGVTFPSSVTSVSSNVFRYCNSLNAIHISDLAAWCNIVFNSGGMYSNPLELGHNLYLNGNLVTDLVIPDGITKINACAFQACTSITSVTIPDSVTEIQQYAFWHCTNLQSVSIPDSLTMIGTDVFDSCTSLNAVYITDLEAWCNLTFPTQIANPLYYGHNLYVNGVLGTITIPNTVTNIKQYAFIGLANSVVIPSNVTTIGNYAFYKSSSPSVTLNEGLQSVGMYAFSENSAATQLILPDSLTTFGNYSFSKWTALTDLQIGHTVTVLGGTYVFSGCSALESLTLPDNVETLGRSTFENCTNLKNIDMGKLKTIGEASFAYATSLENVTIGGYVETIGQSAFYGCNKLKSVTVPPSVKTSSYYAFYSCGSLNAVYITDLEAWCKIDFYNGGCYTNPLEYAHNLYLNGNLVTDLVIPDGITKINACAFQACTSITSVTIPDSVTEIQQYAFWHCTNLQSVSIPDSLTMIGTDVFDSCTSLNAVYITDLEAWCNLTFPTQIANPLYYGHNLYVNGVLGTITIPNTVTNIKQYAFIGLANSVVIPSNVTTIGNYAFYKSSSPSVTLNEGLQSVGMYAFSENSAATQLILPDSLTTFGNYSFSKWTALTDLQIGHTVTVLGGTYVFSGCSALESLTLPDNVETLGRSTFENCTNLKNIDMGKLKTIGEASFAYATSLENVTIGGYVETIGQSAFYGCNKLKSVTVPPSVKTSSYYAFYSCGSLNAVYITDLEAWCKIDFYNGGCYTNPLEYAHNLYLNGNLVTDLVIPDGITKINACAFQACTSITSVTIPDSVTEIQQYAFWHAFGLESIIIPSSVTTMGGGIFDSCSALQHYFCFKGTRGDTYWTNTSTKYYIGDMNSDKVFDINDIGAILSASVGSLNMSEIQEIVADYNLDGVVDAFDAAELDRIMYSVNTAKGDVNQDGEINEVDYAMVKSYVECTNDLLSTDYLESRYDTLKTQYPEGTIITQQYYCADIDSDKAVDAFDLFYLDKRINNLI